MSEQKAYKVVRVALVAVLAALLLTAFVVFAHGNRIHRTYWRARRAVYAGRYEQAATDLNRCVRARPRDPDGWELLSKARFWTGDYQGALDALDVHLEQTALRDRSRTVLWHDYVWARAHGELPVGMTPSSLTSCRWRALPEAFSKGRSLMGEARHGDGGYQEVAELFEASLGDVPRKYGDMDALWGMAIARFHAGDLDGALEALDRIRSEWGGQPSEAFEAVVVYVKSCVPGEPPPLGMPLVLREWATYHESKRQSGDGQR